MSRKIIPKLPGVVQREPQLVAKKKESNASKSPAEEEEKDPPARQQSVASHEEDEAGDEDPQQTLKWTNPLEFTLSILQEEQNRYCVRYPPVFVLPDSRSREDHFEYVDPEYFASIDELKYGAGWISQEEVFARTFQFDPIPAANDIKDYMLQASKNERSLVPEPSLWVINSKVRGSTELAGYAYLDRRFQLGVNYRKQLPRVLVAIPSARPERGAQVAEEARKCGFTDVVLFVDKDNVTNYKESKSSLVYADTLPRLSIGAKRQFILEYAVKHQYETVIMVDDSVLLDKIQRLHWNEQGNRAVSLFELWLAFEAVFGAVSTCAVCGVSRDVRIDQRFNFGTRASPLSRSFPYQLFAVRLDRLEGCGFQDVKFAEEILFYMDLVLKDRDVVKLRAFLFKTMSHQQRLQSGNAKTLIDEIKTIPPAFERMMQFVWPADMPPPQTFIDGAQREKWFTDFKKKFAKKFGNVDSRGKLVLSVKGYTANLTGQAKYKSMWAKLWPVWLEQATLSAYVKVHGKSLKTRFAGLAQKGSVSTVKQTQYKPPKKSVEKIVKLAVEKPMSEEEFEALKGPRIDLNFEQRRRAMIYAENHVVFPRKDVAPEADISWRTLMSFKDIKNFKAALNASKTPKPNLLVRSEDGGDRFAASYMDHSSSRVKVEYVHKWYPPSEHGKRFTFEEAEEWLRLDRIQLIVPYASKKFNRGEQVRCYVHAVLGKVGATVLFSVKEGYLVQYKIGKWEEIACVQPPDMSRDLEESESDTDSDSKRSGEESESSSSSNSDSESSSDSGASSDSESSSSSDSDAGSQTDKDLSQL